MQTMVVTQYKVENRTGIPYYENASKNFVLHQLAKDPNMDYYKVNKLAGGRNIPKHDFETVKIEIQHDRALQELVKRINPGFNFTRELVSSAPSVSDCDVTLTVIPVSSIASMISAAISDVSTVALAFTRLLANTS